MCSVSFLGHCDLVDPDLIFRIIVSGAYHPELSETQNYAYWYARFFPGTHVFR